MHRTKLLDATHHRGIAVTTPARTLIDLAASFHYRPLRRAVREAQRQPHQDPGHRLRPTTSELEDTLLELLLNAGFKRPDINQPMIIDGRRIVPDFRWPNHHLVIEADGAHWHEDPLTRHDDAEKQAILEAAGERVIRITWAQATAQRRQTIHRIRAAGRPTRSDQQG